MKHMNHTIIKKSNTYFIIKFEKQIYFSFFPSNLDFFLRKKQIQISFFPQLVCPKQWIWKKNYFLFSYKNCFFSVKTSIYKCVFSISSNVMVNKCIYLVRCLMMSFIESSMYSVYWMKKTNMHKRCYTNSVGMLLQKIINYCIIEWWIFLHYKFGKCRATLSFNNRHVFNKRAKIA